jgi:hypothetical protein
MEMGPFGWTICIVALVVVLWWWIRPVHWKDGEGSLEPDNPLHDSDVGSLRWWFFGRGQGRFLTNAFAWYENTFRRR